MKKQILALASAFTFAIIAMTANTASAAQVKVEKGDTLWTISKEHHVSVGNLKKINHLHSNLILAGATLQIGSKKTKERSLYTIKVGDTLSKIALKTGTTVKKLKAYNQLSSDLIIAGTTLSLTNEDQKIIPGKKAVVKKQATAKNVKTTAVSNPVSKKTSQQKTRNTTQQSNSSERTLTMTATAYVADCPGCSGITATGIDVRNSTPNLIAVDPSVIPLGSTVWVEGYGTAVAGDTGGAIKGNRIDLLVADYDTAVKYGVHTVTVEILN
ncbi:MAG: LysM peptidoglycan-binding domain-containing protein [Kurthia sp.]|nr:LysM peptidoglycan-binding domain-containing protein [Candidatus Kurthia equi]